MREIVYTGQYKRDLKRARKRQMPEDDPNEVIRLLAEDQPLPLERRDHGTYWGVFWTARMSHTSRLVADIQQRKHLPYRKRRCNKRATHSKPYTYWYTCRLILIVLLDKTE